MQLVRSVIKAFPPTVWARLGIGFMFLLVPVFIFAELAEEVGQRETLVYDEFILRAVNSISSPFMDIMAVGLTQLGGVVGVGLLTVGAILFFVARRRYKWALIVASCVAGAGLINVLLKAVFQRDRPQLWERIVTENSYSFPSGHAMASSALALSLVVIFWPTRWRWYVVSVAALYMLIIGFTRLYLGVHYPTDVVAGWTVSAAWVAVVTITTLYWRRSWASFRQFQDKYTTPKSSGNDTDAPR